MSNTEMNYQEINNTYDAIKELYVEYCEVLDKEKKNLELLSNQIKETKEYIQYLGVRQQNDLNERTVVYIPTEANLPILEANRTNSNQ